MIGNNGNNNNGNNNPTATMVTVCFPGLVTIPYGLVNRVTIKIDPITESMALHSQSNESGTVIKGSDGVWYLISAGADPVHADDIVTDFASAAEKIYNVFSDAGLPHNICLYAVGAAFF